MHYLGGKNGAGTWQRIINQIPPHSLYIEPFCGSAAIARRKRPAAVTVLIDRNPAAIAAVEAELQAAGWTVISGYADRAYYAEQYAGSPLALCLVGNGLWWLEKHAARLPADALVYADPPYLRSTRASNHRYMFELDDDAGHLKILQTLKALPCRVLLSGYWSQLYADNLCAAADWRVADNFEVITRGGSMAREYLWANYAEPVELHDYRFLGANFRQRERFNRQRKRWAARLAKMSVLQRRALMSALQDDLVPSSPTAIAAAHAVCGDAVPALLNPEP